MKPRNLASWLDYIESLHPETIELGLDRVGRVARRLKLLPFSPVTIVVGGTNGKGSVVAILESIYTDAGYSVGSYTSPHLLRYNERMHIDCKEVSDDVLCNAFSRVEQARGDIELTYFEFGTLAAVVVFKSRAPDIVILEVGLGGRLDAVNLFDADVAVVTSIDLDHMDWLGTSREQIGFEKAGIFRARMPAICGDPDPPASVRDVARVTGARLYIQDRDFTLQCTDKGCTFRGDRVNWTGLPTIALSGRHQWLNTATALMAVVVLIERLPVTQMQVGSAMASVSVPGRFQVLQHTPEVVVDVAHNPQSIRALASLCLARPSSGRTLAVVGMMHDKAIEESLVAMVPLVQQWYLAALPPPRGATSASLERSLLAVDSDADCRLFEGLDSAFKSALSDAQPEDRILCFGSFVTVGAIMRQLS